MTAPTPDPHTTQHVPMAEGCMEAACATFGPKAVLPIRWTPGDNRPFRARWRNVVSERCERDADRARRARHFLTAYARRAAA